MPNKITVRNKEFDAQRLMNVGEVREVRKSNLSILGINKKAIAEASEVDLIEYSNSILSKTEEQDELVIKILKNCCGFNDKQIEELEYLDAVILFNELYEMSTIIRKNLEKPLSLASKEEIPPSQS